MMVRKGFLLSIGRGLVAVFVSIQGDMVEIQLDMGAFK